VTSADVRRTAQFLVDARPALRDLLQVPRLEQASFQVDFNLLQGYLNPLALFTFKVLPQTYHGKALVRPDDSEFAKAPIGSGPYIYQGRVEAGGMTEAVFAANPQYRRSPDKQRPYLDEIHLFARQGPAKDFPADRARNTLLLDVPTEDLRTLKSKGFSNLRSLLPRRVYFLAVNHRIPALANLDLRRALAHAIDRERVLDVHFRGGRPELRSIEVVGPATVLPFLSQREGFADFHRALNGPYPPDSWAHCPAPRVPAALFDPGRAKSAFRAVQKLAPIKLTLKYPDVDPQVEGACRALIEQIQALASAADVKVELRGLAISPQALDQAVRQHDYELAYYSLDYAGEDYALWPLFDTRPEALAPGGTNYLGYENDSKLQSLFHAALSHCEFTAVRELTHAIHAHLNAQLPFIPLWQLHYHVALPAGFDPGHLEPLAIFSHAAEWKLPP
jgi:ABC-type transport system substrate-binding protein